MVGKSTVVAAAAMLVFAASAGASPCTQRSGRPWCDASQTPDKRAGQLLKALTQDEKLTLLAGANGDGHTGATNAIDRVGLPKSYNTDGPVGVRQGTATAMPTPMAEAATFDPEMARLHGTTIGNEARAKGNDGVLAPTVNMMRTPLNGRTFEAFGEDPWLVTRLTVAWIEGTQSQGVYATVKHFAANNQEGVDPSGGATASGSFPIGAGFQGSRHFENSVVDERTLREVYLPQFEAAVKEAHVGSIMCSYNRLNGQYACSNNRLLNEIAKAEWGFKNMMMSDWILATHTFDTTNALNGGLDLEMPFPNAYSPPAVQASLTTSQANATTVDDHVRRILRTLFEFGFFDRDAYPNNDAQIDQAGHALNAQRIEESAITLLENRGALPLDASKLKSLAVIGPNADKFVTGGGSGNVTPFKAVTALQGIKDRVGSGVQVTSDDGSDATRAAGVAKAADVAVVVVGDFETEGADRACLTLECPDNGDQDGLVDAVAAAQPNTIVVLETGGPVLTPWRTKVQGLLEAWYPGESGGTAIARVLFGDVDPGGRLPVTFPEREADLPTAGDPQKYPGEANGDLRYKEGVLVGYRWYDAKGLAPAYPFGYGLSYSTFALRNLRITPAAGGATGATVSVDVVNTGGRAGTAVPQLYLGLPQPSADVVQPPKALKGAAKLSLAPGQIRRVSFRVDQRALSYWDTEAGDWAVAPGCYGVMAGHSSREIDQQATVAVGSATCKGAVARIPAPKVRSCASRRAITIHFFSKARRATVRRVTVSLNGKRSRTLRGRRSAVRVVLRGRPKSTVRVRIVIRRSRGKAVVVTRRYHTCVKRKRA
jgi:beta-glucosidase